MDKRKRNYIILSSIIVAEFLVVRIMKDLGIPIASEFLKVLGGAIFLLPIVVLLLHLSNDHRLKKHWRIILRIVVIHSVLAFAVGTILTLFVKV